MFRSLFLIALLLSLAGCTESRVTLGQAYVAPISLKLFSETSTKSNVVAELKHGDHLEIIDVQRRMIRVRTDKGVQGWADSAQLLSPEQMEALKRQQKQESALPPEGTATAYEQLNIHIDPERQSPAFARIAEGAPVTVLGHKIVPRGSGPARVSGIVVTRPQLSRKQRKDQKTAAVSGSMRLPLKPAPPKPPANWLELSAERINGGTQNEEPAADAPKAVDKKPPPTVKTVPVKKPDQKPVVMDDWTLVRTKNNEIGWVLTRNLLMSIPDDVAQYAEGKSITAFFDLGTVNDDVKGPKHNWLWTTSARGVAYDFDSWRVFLWNAHKHRYETSFRQRDLEGYFPVTVAPPDPGSPLRSFSLVTRDDDGKLRLHSYTFDGHLVHLANTEDYNPSASAEKTAAALNTSDLATKAKPQGWFNRQWATVKHRIWGN